MPEANDPNHVDCDGMTPAMRAAVSGDLDDLRELLQKGANLSLTNPEGKTAAMLAASSAMSAACHGHVKVLEELIAAKVDLNKQDEDGWTALMFAASGGHAEAVKTLVLGGADRSLRNKEGEDAEALARSYRHSEALRALSLNIDLDLGDANGMTPVMTAAVNGNVKLLGSWYVVEKLFSLNVQCIKLNKSSHRLDNLEEDFNIGCVRTGASNVLKAISDSGKYQDLLEAKTPDGGTPAMSAAVHGRVDALRVLIANKVDLDVQDEDGWTALMYAAVSGHSNCVQALVLAGAKRNIKNEDGDTATALAKSQRFTEVLRALDFGADLDLADTEGMTALMKAATDGNTDLIRDLAAAGAKLDLQTVEGKTAVMIAAGQAMSAAVHGRVEALQILIANGADVDRQDEDGWTALMYAASSGQAAAVQALVLAGANRDLESAEGESAETVAASAEVKRALSFQFNCNVVKVEGGDGLTPLQRAALAGDILLMKELLGVKGVLVDLQNADGKSALMLAAGEGQAAAAVCLMEHGADVNLSTDDGGTPAMSAAVHGRVNALRALVAHGADINRQDEDGWTALMYAASGGHAAATQVLVLAGANRGLVNSDGHTAEREACGSEVFRALRFEFDCNVAQVDGGDGLTPLMRAASSGDLHLMRELLAVKGTDINLQSCDGKTAVMLAAGSDVNCETPDGGTPAMSAAVHGNTAALGALIFA
eukprot:gene16984-20188_t